MILYRLETLIIKDNRNLIVFVYLQNMLRKLYLLLFLFPFFLGAQSYPAKPGNYVTDETGTLTQEQQNDLNAKLKVFEDTTTNQIFVYVAKSLNGNDLEQLSEEIFHNWQVGQKDKNNGVLIAVFIDDHKFRIQTGYGLEGALPDLLTKRIQDNDMRPYFKKGDYYGGINSGIDKLIYYSKHEFVEDEVESFVSGWQSWAIGYGANLLMLLIYIYNLRKKNKNNNSRNNVFTIIAVVVALFPCIGALILFFMTSWIQKGSGGGFSSDGSSWSSWSSSDSSWSSSDSSSDFGGGGGGDSGGGGSSSDW